MPDEKPSERGVPVPERPSIEELFGLSEASFRQAGQALAWVVDLMEVTGARLTALHVMERRSSLLDSFRETDSDQEDAEVRRASCRGVTNAQALVT